MPFGLGSVFAFSQQRASTASRWQRTKLSNIETGQRRVDILEAHELAKFYGIAISDLEAVIKEG